LHPGCGHKKFKRPPKNFFSGTARIIARDSMQAATPTRTTSCWLSCYHSGQGEGKKKKRRIHSNPKEDVISMNLSDAAECGGPVPRSVARSLPSNSFRNGLPAQYSKKKANPSCNIFHQYFNSP
jgi:hypothetical protein